MFDERFGTVPVREVEAYADAESVFEDYASGNKQPSIDGFGSISNSSGTELEYPWRCFVKREK